MNQSVPVEYNYEDFARDTPPEHFLYFVFQIRRWTLIAAAMFPTQRYVVCICCIWGDTLSRDFAWSPTEYFLRDLWVRVGPKKFLGLFPKQRTPPTHQPLRFRTFRKIDRFSKFHEKIICSEWSNMPYKHDIVLSLKSLGLLTPTHPQFRTFS